VKVDIRDLQEGENALSWEESPQDLLIDESELSFVGPIRTRMVVLKIGEAMSAAGETSFTLQLECARCLEAFQADCTASFSFIFQRDRPAAMAEDEDDALIWLDDKSEQVDLGGEVRDYILLEVPQGPVCSDACEGLCPVCGEKLGEGHVGCKSETVDPRWDALRALKEE